MFICTAIQLNSMILLILLHFNKDKSHFKDENNSPYYGTLTTLGSPNRTTYDKTFKHTCIYVVKSNI